MNLHYIYTTLRNELPQQLIDALKKIPSFKEVSFINTHKNDEQLTSIRVNPFKASLKYDDLVTVKWCPSGKYLSERPSFTFDPMFQAGAYYVQEASSMFIDHVLQQLAIDEETTILDLCAAPGGKSTLISSALNGKGLLVANEIIKTRVNILADNLTKWGACNTIVTNNDPKDFNRLGGFFDIIVADAPCSGSGMFRKDPGAIDEWSEDNVILCSQRQQRILADVYPSLKEGGYFIYSTCSYSEEENEQIVDWLMDTFEMESLALPIKQDWGIAETQSAKHKGYGYRFYPDQVKGEGFFIACLKKTQQTGTSRLRKLDLKNLVLPKKEEAIVAKWLDHAKAYTLLQFSGEIYALPKNEFNTFLMVQQALYIKKSGVKIGKIAGNDLIPDHEFALSVILNNHVERINLDKETAIKYLRRDDIKIDTDYKGWALICFEGFALGWAKILPNRINNYFPKELRILKDMVRE